MTTLDGIAELSDRDAAREMRNYMDETEAAEIAERCRVAVASEPIVTPVGPIRVTISLGIAARPARGLEPGAPGSETSPPKKRCESWGSDEELIAEALDRLREAKRAGRNRTVC